MTPLALCRTRRASGTLNTRTRTKVLMLGSGELGKEVVIELMRLGVEVVACDRYPSAPAMQVAHRSPPHRPGREADDGPRGDPSARRRRARPEDVSLPLRRHRAGVPRRGRQVGLARGADVDEARAKAKAAAAAVRVDLGG